jgi:membrane associated rhomboid family serine protease
MGGTRRPFVFPQQTEACLFPIRDTVRSRSFSAVNYGLIAINVLVFLFQASLGPRAFERLINAFGAVPAQISLLQPLSLIPLFTSMFLHGGWFHLISNMWILFIFGDNVEDRMGSLRYLVFYLLAGSVAGFTHVYFSPGSTIPTVGASGAIAGVLGAYFVLFPSARVTTFVPLFFLPWFIEVPAFLFIGIWFLSQLSSGLLQLGAYGDFGAVAWWAHIGGFVVGVLLVSFFARRPRVRRLWYPDEHWPW